MKNYENYSDFIQLLNFLIILDNYFRDILLIATLIRSPIQPAL